MNRNKSTQAFTLAEVLITLGIIGVVAAIMLPSFIENMQSRIKAEQIRSVKYKFTKATTQMAAQGKIGPYTSTAAFVAELQKHLKVMKVCDSNHLRDCWPYDKVILEDGKEYDITKATTGKAFKMESNDSADYTSDNVGLVLADGTPMILSFNKKCEWLDPIKTYNWSTSDNKPVTNATTGCVAAIFEINGTKRPNKFADDVVAFNAKGLGSSCVIEAGGKCYSAPFIPTPMTFEECTGYQATHSGTNTTTAAGGDAAALGIKACNYANDYWAGAVKQCGGTSNMPTMDDLAKLASTLYVGNPTIGAKEDVYSLDFDEESTTAIALGLTPLFYLWSGEEDYSGIAYHRGFGSTLTSWHYGSRIPRGNSNIHAVCLGG